MASSHPNSFLDGVMLMSLLNRQTFTLARGDAFLKKRSNQVLRSLNLLPIFRATDADPRESVRRNNEMFEETFDLLAMGNIVIIYPEAISVTEKRVRPLKKGTARMAVDVFKRSDKQMDLSILPVGINYTSFAGPRKDCMIQIGKPIKMQNRLEDLNAHEAKFVNSITKEIEELLNELMIVTPKEQSDASDDILKIHRMEDPLGPLVQFDRSSTQFDKEKAVSDVLMQGVNNELFANHKEYTNKRTDLKLEEYPKYSFSQLVSQALFFVVTIIPSLVAIFLHGWTMANAARITPRRLKNVHFFDSVFIGTALIGLYVTAIVCYVLAYLFFGWGGVLIYWALRWCVPMYYQNMEFLKTIRNKRKWSQAAQSGGKDFDELLAYRQKVLSALPSVR